MTFDDVREKLPSIITYEIICVLPSTLFPSRRDAVSTSYQKLSITYACSVNLYSFIEPVACLHTVETCSSITIWRASHSKLNAKTTVWHATNTAGATTLSGNTGAIDAAQCTRSELAFTFKSEAFYKGPHRSELNTSTCDFCQLMVAPMEEGCYAEN